MRQPATACGEGAEAVAAAQAPHSRRLDHDAPDSPGAQNFIALPDARASPEQLRLHEWRLGSQQAATRKHRPRHPGQPEWAVPTWQWTRPD